MLYQLGGGDVTFAVYIEPTEESRRYWRQVGGEDDGLYMVALIGPIREQMLALSFRREPLPHNLVMVDGRGRKIEWEDVDWTTMGKAVRGE